MTFNDDAKINSSGVRRRGRGTALAVGGGGLGIGAFIVILLLQQFTGIDASPLLGDQGTSNGADEPISQCETGADANARLDCRLAASADSLDTYWADQLPDVDVQPDVLLFTDQTNTGCGAASSATGPFYCPADQSIYIDTAFYDELRTTYGADGGPLSELYVLGHEWGHHIQHVTGVTDGLDLQDTGRNSDSVKLELQADCYAGAWLGDASDIDASNGEPFLEPITKAQIADALSAASAVGDDRIQQSAGASVNPEAWTHGSSAARQQWFQTGFAGGPASCDTFA